MNKVFMFSIVLLFSTALSAQKTAKQVYQNATPAVVSLTTYDADNNALGSGSGLLVRSNGVVVSNFHVVKNAHHAIIKLQNGEKFNAIGRCIVNYDINRDFVILKIPGFNLPTVTLGNSDLVETGDKVLAIGNPKGLDNSLSEGLVSQIQKFDGSKFIQTTAAISAGSSGGGLFNMNGEVIAITTAQLNEGQNLNFALPINYVSGALDNLSIKYDLSKISVSDNPAKEEERDENIDAKFGIYEDKDGYFDIGYLKMWTNEYDNSWNDDKSVLTKTFMSAPKYAEKAVYNGYLSEGIRITFDLPKTGNVWTTSTTKEYGDVFMKRIQSYNPGFVVTESVYSTLANGKDCLIFSMVGQNQNTSEPEKTTFVIAANEKYRMRVEMVSPTSRLALNEVILLGLFKTLVLKK
jgi:hypothetical protein